MSLLSWFRRRQSERLNFEREWKVFIDGHTIELLAPKQPAQRLELGRLSGVIVETNDSGPWGADVWWLLFGPQDTVAIAFPQGATGEQAVIDRLMALPGFDHGEMIKAMRSTGNAVFPVWRAPGLE